MSAPSSPKDLPADFAVALMTGRPEVLEHLYRPNGLSEKETAQVSKAFGDLIKVNIHLKWRLDKMIQVINHVYAMGLDLEREIDQLRDLTNLSSPDNQECHGK